MNDERGGVRPRIRIIAFSKLRFSEVLKEPFYA